MDFKKSKLVGIALTFVLICYSCDEKVCNECEIQNYDFKDSISIYPNSETINQGDTLWFDCQVLTQHYDFNTKKIVSFIPEKILQIFTFQHLVAKNNTEDALTDFNVIFERGNSYTTYQANQNLGLIYNFNGTSYGFKLGLIPKKNVAKGIYYILLNQTGDLKSKNGNSASFALHLKCKNQHLNLYYENFKNPILAPEFEKTVYCFGVAE
jgi:hypothetical protein